MLGRLERLGMVESTWIVIKTDTRGKAARNDPPHPTIGWGHSFSVFLPNSHHCGRSFFQDHQESRGIVFPPHGPVMLIRGTCRPGYRRGYPNKKKRSGAKKRSRGQKSAPGSKKKCSREHLSRALLRSVLFLAINKRWPKLIITPHTYCRSSITTAVTALSPTRPRHHRQCRRPPPRQLLPDNNQRRGATDPPPSSDMPSRHGMPPPRGGGKV
jgi:hypothetical protein